MATHFSILAWGVPWTEEPGVPHSMGSLGVGHDLMNEQPQQFSLNTCLSKNVFFQLKQSSTLQTSF